MGVAAPFSARVVNGPIVFSNPSRTPSCLSDTVARFPDNFSGSTCSSEDRQDSKRPGRRIDVENDQGNFKGDDMVAKRFKATFRPLALWNPNMSASRQYASANSIGRMRPPIRRRVLCSHLQGLRCFGQRNLYREFRAEIRVILRPQVTFMGLHDGAGDG